ncbi:MAG: hypothetical protein EXR72_13360 [Myxococcales bacterium]|nr:hypothetical protein [Myxococcales bacterium]
MPHRRYLLLLLPLLLSACNRIPDEDPAALATPAIRSEALPEPPPVTSVAPRDEPAAAAPRLPEEPPPRSEIASEVAPPALDPDAALRIYQGSHTRNGGRILAVRGRVRAVKPVVRPLPRAQSWGPELPYATVLDVAITEVLCGRPESEIVQVWYAGAALPDGRGFRTSQMPADLPVGSEHVFWLENLDGDWFLTAGRGSLLAPAADHHLRTPDGALVAAAALKGVCR